MDFEEFSREVMSARLRLAESQPIREGKHKLSEDQKYDRQRYKSEILEHIDNWTRERQRETQLSMPLYLPPCVTPLQDLQKCFLKDLNPDIRTRGVFVLLKVATSHVALFSVVAVMEDEEESSMLVELGQHQGKGPHLSIERIRMQEVCIVKEPWFVIRDDGSKILRVDHLSDIIWLAPDSEKIPLPWREWANEGGVTAEMLKEQGNAAMKRDEFHTAVESYTLALKCPSTSETSQTLRLNRSLANLKLYKYEKALEDTNGFATNASPPEKGLYRKALSLYGLENFVECRKTLETLLSFYPNCYEAKRELSRTKKRLQEQELGEYDFDAMRKEAGKTSTPCLDHATFTGDVTVKASTIHGLGLFTTEDVKAGDLLLCEKAFSFCARDQKSVALNDTEENLTTATIHKMFHNPSLRPMVTSLYHGDYEAIGDGKVDDLPVVDSFLVGRIVRFNSIACIDQKVWNSVFRDRTARPEEKSIFGNWGLFIRASFVNHSCYRNAIRVPIGDMQIIRAARNLKAGSEIFFEYVGLANTYEETQERLHPWNFRCTCPICQEDYKTDKAVTQRRLTYIEDFKKLVWGGTEVDVQRVEQLLAAMETVYSALATEVPRIDIAELYLLLMRFYWHMNQPVKTIETAWKVVASYGFKIKRQNPQSLNSPFEIEEWGFAHAHLITVWFQLSVAYEEADLRKKAEEYARLTYKICAGEDTTYDIDAWKACDKRMQDELHSPDPPQSLTP